MWIWNGTVTMTRRKLNRRKTKRSKIRRRIRMRMMAKYLGQ